MPGVDVPIGVNFMVRDVGCERQDKSWTDVYGAPLLKKGRWGWGLVLSSYDRKGEGCQRMNEARYRKSFRGEGGSLLLLILAEKRCLELESICMIGKPLY